MPDRGWDLVAATSLALRRIQLGGAFDVAVRSGLAELGRTLADVADLCQTMAAGLTNPGQVIAAASGEATRQRTEYTDVVARYHASAPPRARRLEVLAPLSPFVAELQVTLTSWATMPDDFVGSLADDYATAAFAGELSPEDLLNLSDSLRKTAASVEQFIGLHWT